MSLLFRLTVLKCRELELLTSQDSGPHLWIASRNHTNASKMKRHDLLKLILFLLVKLLPAYPLYCCHPSIFLWRMRQRCSVNSHKPQHTSGTSSCKHQNLLQNKLKTPLEHQNTDRAPECIFSEVKHINPFISSHLIFQIIEILGD